MFWCKAHSKGSVNGSLLRQPLFLSLLELFRSDLRSPGIISRLGRHPCSRWEFSQKMRERTTWGDQSFQELIHFLYFLGLLIYFLLYIEIEYKVTRGQQTWSLSKSGASYKCIQKVLGGFTSSFGHEACWHLWPFLSNNSQLTRKPVFQECFFLNQVSPSEGTR